MNIITRPDFDGVASAVFLKDALKINTPVKWIEPYEMKKRSDEVEIGDIIANLPYNKNCGFWFDHHDSNRIDTLFEGAFDIAPSAASPACT